MKFSVQSNCIDTLFNMNFVSADEVIRADPKNSGQLLVPVLWGQKNVSHRQQRISRTSSVCLVTALMRWARNKRI